MPPPAEGLASRLFLGPALRTQPDRRLVTLVREGYETAFEEIVRRYGKPLSRYAASIVGGRSEDVTQDAFSKALLALRRDDAEIELRPWLFRIVRNTALNDLRDSPPSPEVLAEAIAGGGNPAEELERREELADLMQAPAGAARAAARGDRDAGAGGTGPRGDRGGAGPDRRRRKTGDLPSAAGAARRRGDAHPAAAAAGAARRQRLRSGRNGRRRRGERGGRRRSRRGRGRAEGDRGDRPGGGRGRRWGRPQGQPAQRRRRGRAGTGIPERRESGHRARRCAGQELEAREESRDRGGSVTATGPERRSPGTIVAVTAGRARDDTAENPSWSTTTEVAAATASPSRATTMRARWIVRGAWRQFRPRRLTIIRVPPAVLTTAAAPGQRLRPRRRLGSGPAGVRGPAARDRRVRRRWLRIDRGSSGGGPEPNEEPTLDDDSSGSGSGSDDSGSGSGGGSGSGLERRRRSDRSCFVIFVPRSG